MTPLTLLTATRAQARGTCCVLAARPSGVLHAYVGPLSPSGQFVPRSGRTVCRAHTRTLGVVALSGVGDRRVCGRCTARLTRGTSAGGVGIQPPTRASLLAAYDGVTPFDLAVDAWRAGTEAEVEQVQHLALLLVGFPACKTEPVVSPNGKVTGPLDEHIKKARRRLGIIRDPMTPALRSTARENELLANHAAKQRRNDRWRDREARIERLGFINATA